MSGAVVVTGAAGGAGLAIARRARAAGHAVVGVDIDAERLARSAAESDLIPVVGDVGAWATHEAAADAAARAGGVVGWVNNAGIDIQGAAHETTEADIERGFHTLLLGQLYGMAVAVRRMLPQRAGAIVNVSSIQAVATFPRYFVYGAAKAALLQATRSVAVDYAPYGLRCNAVLPGTIDTPMLDLVLPPDVPRDEALRREGELSPMGRIASAEEIAEAVWFLLSDASSYVTGASLVVDGGSTARCFAYPSIDVDG